MVNKFFPSTQLCPVCNKKTKLPVWERTYVCISCNYTEDRDIKSAKCILTEGLKKFVPTNSKTVSKYFVPTERREVKPRETESSVSTIFAKLENIVNVSFVKTIDY